MLFNGFVLFDLQRTIIICSVGKERKKEGRKEGRKERRKCCIFHVVFFAVFVLEQVRYIMIHFKFPHAP